MEFILLTVQEWLKRSRLTLITYGSLDLLILQLTQEIYQTNSGRLIEQFPVGLIFSVLKIDASMLMSSFESLVPLMLSYCLSVTMKKQFDDSVKIY